MIFFKERQKRGGSGWDRKPCYARKKQSIFDKRKKRRPVVVKFALLEQPGLARWG